MPPRPRLPTDCTAPPSPPAGGSPRRRPPGPQPGHHRHRRPCGTGTGTPSPPSEHSWMTLNPNTPFILSKTSQPQRNINTSRESTPAKQTELRVGPPLCPRSPGETGLCRWIVPEQRHGPPSPSSAGPPQLPDPRILHDTLPASPVFPGRVDPHSPVLSASPTSSMHPPGLCDLVASLDGSISHSSSWILGWDPPGSWAQDSGPSCVPAVGTRGAHGEGLGSGWTYCKAPGARGSKDRLAEPCYPGKGSLSQWNLVVLGESHDPGRTSLSWHSPLLFCTGASGGGKGGM